MGFHLRFSGALAVLAPMLMCSLPASAGQNCLFEPSPPGAPYRVLGAPVSPQSNYLVIDDCTKTIEEVRADLLAPAREREEAVAQAEEERQSRAEGDRLTRIRDEALRAEAEKQEQGVLKSWWARLWGS